MALSSIYVIEVVLDKKNQFLRNKERKYLNGSKTGLFQFNDSFELYGTSTTQFANVAYVRQKAGGSGTKSPTLVQEVMRSNLGWVVSRVWAVSCPSSYNTGVTQL